MYVCACVWGIVSKCLCQRAVLHTQPVRFCARTRVYAGALVRARERTHIHARTPIRARRTIASLTNCPGCVWLNARLPAPGRPFAGLKCRGCTGATVSTGFKFAATPFVPAGRPGHVGRSERRRDASGPSTVQVPWPACQWTLRRRSGPPPGYPMLPGSGSARAPLSIASESTN